MATAVRLPPADVAERLFGVDMWDTPREILASVFRPNSRTAVKACHSSSKTHTAALAVLLTLYEGGDVLTTAPTWEQVKTVLWGMVHRILQDAVIPLSEWGSVNQTEIVMPDGSHALGLSTNEGVRFQGWHARPGSFLLLIGDEAPGVRPDIFEAWEGISAGGDVRHLLLGNPVISSGYFFDIFAGDSPIWRRFTIDAFDTPNLSGLDLLGLLQLPESELVLSARPYLVTRQWVIDRYREWGEDHPLWQSRVRGQFPLQSDDALLSLAWLEAAANREGRYDPGLTVQAGVDVAGPGDDETVLCVRQGDAVLDLQAWSLADSRGAVIAALAPWKSRGLDAVNVDAVGMGHYFASALEDDGLPVVRVNVGEAPTDDKAREKFANLRAQMFWSFREWAEAGMLSGLDDRTALAQLAGIRYAHDNRGRVVIEKKDDARKRGVKALAVDTPIPTPDGWALMGDLQPGDAVFDDEGQPTVVVAATPAFQDQPCYAVRFSDGHEIIAEAGHLWKTYRYHSGLRNGEAMRGRPRWQRTDPVALRTTEAIAATLVNHRQGGWNHHIPVAPALDLPDRSLPLPPYVLGYWLGDGNSDDPRLTVSMDDLDEVAAIVAAEGMLTTVGAGSARNSCVRLKLGGDARLGEHRADSVRARLARLEVLGNKHIPTVYLRASASQRFDLLQGLLDSDGTIAADRGRIELSLSYPSLAEGIAELLVSLGIKATHRVANYGFRDTARFQFMVPAEQPAFRLRRKAELQRPRPSSRPISGNRSIVACDPVPSVPVRCITVAAPSGMFLAGRGMIPTHNSPDRAEAVALAFWSRPKRLLTAALGRAMQGAARPSARERLEERRRLREQRAPAGRWT